MERPGIAGDEAFRLLRPALLAGAWGLRAPTRKGHKHAAGPWSFRHRGEIPGNASKAYRSGAPGSVLKLRTGGQSWGVRTAVFAGCLQPKGSTVEMVSRGYPRSNQTKRIL